MGDAGVDPDLAIRQEERSGRAVEQPSPRHVRRARPAPQGHPGRRRRRRPCRSRMPRLLPQPPATAALKADPAGRTLMRAPCPAPVAITSTRSSPTARKRTAMSRRGYAGRVRERMLKTSSALSARAVIRSARRFASRRRRPQLAVVRAPEQPDLEPVARRDGPASPLPVRPSPMDSQCHSGCSLGRRRP